MHIYLCSQCLMLTFRIRLFHSVSRCLYRKNVLSVDTNLQQSEGIVPHENELASLAEVFKEIAQQEMEDCSGFCLL